MVLPRFLKVLTPKPSSKLTCSRRVVNKLNAVLADIASKCAVESDQSDDIQDVLMDVLNHPIREIKGLFSHMLSLVQNLFSVIDPDHLQVLMSHDMVLRERKTEWRSVFKRHFRSLVNVSRSQLVLVFSVISSALIAFYRGTFSSDIFGILALVSSVLQISDSAVRLKKLYSKVSWLKSSISNSLSWRNFVRCLLFISLLFLAYQTGGILWSFMLSFFKRSRPAIIECAANIDDLLKLCVTVLFCTLGVALPSAFLDRFMRTSTFLGTATVFNGGLSNFITKFLEWIVSAFSTVGLQSAADWITNNSTLTNIENYTRRNGVLDVLDRDVSFFLAQRTTPTSGPGTQTYVATARDLIRRCGELSTTLHNIEGSTYILNMVAHMRGKLEQALSASLFVRDFSRKRVEPLTVLFVGPPRIGKTWALGAIKDALQEMLKHLEGEQGWMHALHQSAVEGRWSYSRNRADEFWSGYNREPVLVFDDVFTGNPAEKGDEAARLHQKELLELQTLVGTQPYSPPLPEVGSGVPCPKGTKISPQLLLATSNYLFANVGHQNSTIIDDRIHKVVLVLPTGKPKSTDLSHLAFFESIVRTSALREAFPNQMRADGYVNADYPATLEAFNTWVLSKFFRRIDARFLLQEVVDGMRQKALESAASDQAVEQLMRPVFAQLPYPDLLDALTQFCRHNHLIVSDSFEQNLITTGIVNAISMLQAEPGYTRLVSCNDGDVALNILNAKFVGNTVQTSGCDCAELHHSEFDCPTFEYQAFHFQFKSLDTSPVAYQPVAYNNGELLFDFGFTTDPADLALRAMNALARHHYGRVYQNLSEFFQVGTRNTPAHGYGVLKSTRRLVCVNQGVVRVLHGENWQVNAHVKNIVWFPYPDRVCCAQRDFWEQLQHALREQEYPDPVWIRHCLANISGPPQSNSWLWYCYRDYANGPAQWGECRWDEQDLDEFKQWCYEVSPAYVDVADQLASRSPSGRECATLYVCHVLKMLLGTHGRVINHFQWTFIDPETEERTLIPSNENALVEVHFEDTIGVQYHMQPSPLPHAFADFVRMARFDAERPPQNIALYTVWNQLQIFRPQQNIFGTIQSALIRLRDFVVSNSFTIVMATLATVATIGVVQSLVALFRPRSQECSTSLHRISNPHVMAQPKQVQGVALGVRHVNHDVKCKICPQVPEMTYSKLDVWKHNEIVRRLWQTAKTPERKNQVRQYLKAMYNANLRYFRVFDMTFDQAMDYLVSLQQSRQVVLTHSGTYMPLVVANSLLCTRSKTQLKLVLEEQNALIRNILGNDFNRIDEFMGPLKAMPETCKIEPRTDYSPCFALALIQKQRAQRGYKPTEADLVCTCVNECAIDEDLMGALLPAQVQSQQAKWSKHNVAVVDVDISGSQSKGTIVAEGVLAVCKHALRPLFEQDKDKHKVLMTSVGGCEEFWISQKDVLLTQNKTDVALIKIPSTQLPTLKVSKHIVSDELSKGTPVSFIWYSMGKGLRYSSGTIEGTTMSSAKFGLNYRLYKVDGFPEAREGLSGTLVVVGAQIVGHFYGIQNSTNVRLVQPWIKKDMIAIISAFQRSEAYDTLPGDDDVQPCSFRHIVDMPTTQLDAQAPTQIRPSPISKFLTSSGFASVKQPAALDKQAFVNTFSKFTGFVENFDPDYLKSAKELSDYFTELIEVEYGAKAKTVATWQDVAQGMHAGEVLGKGVVIDTSAGYPFCVMGYKKRDLFSGQPPKLQPNALLTRILDNELEKFLDGDVTPTLCTANLKDELRDHERVQQKKTRLFSATPVHTNMLYRKYCMDWMSKYKKMRFEQNFSAVGADVFGEDWTTLRQILEYPCLEQQGAPVKNHFIIGDFSRFDISHSRWKLSLAMDVIAAGCEDPDQVHKLGLKLSNYMVAQQGSVVRVPRGLPSGCQMTTILNCILNILLWLTAWRKLTGLNLENFRKHCRLIVYGDDVVFGMSTNSSFRNIVTPQSIQTIFSNLGYTLESADSKPLRWVSLDEVVFLKRKFVPDPFDDRITHAPRELCEVWTQLHWQRDELDTEQYKTVFLSAALEFGQHGPKVFNHAFEILREAVQPFPKLKHAFALCNFRSVAQDAWVKTQPACIEPSQSASRFWRLW